MLAADRARVPLWDFMAQSVAWRELYRVAVAAERGAEHELAARRVRQQRMAQMRGGR